MRNVTITLDEETARWARLEAARRDTSVSKLVGEMLRQHRADSDRYERARRSFTARAVGALKGPGERYPQRASLYDR